MSSRKAIILAILTTLLVTAAQLLMKLGLKTPWPNLLFDPLLILGVMLTFIGGFVLTMALKFGDLSVVHPLMSLGFVWVVVVSRFIGEIATGMQYAGIASIMLGVFFISMSGVKQ